MGIFEHFPYVNFHELNLDWVLAKIKELTDRVGSVEQALAELKDIISQDVYNLMVQWLNDGTLAGIVSDAVKYKEWAIEDINNIPSGVAFEVGDTITTNTAVYAVVNSGLPFGAYQLYPIYYTKLQDLGLEADGLTDDSAKLQAAYNLIGRINLCGQTVLLNNKITLKSNSSISNGKLKWSANLGIGLEGDNISNFVLKNVELDVSASTPLGKKISINNSNNIVISNIYAHDWYGTLFRLNGNSNVNIKDSVFENSSGGTGDVGAALYSNGGNNLNYENLQSKNLSDNLIYLDGTNDIDNVTITNIKGSGHTGSENPHVLALYGHVYNATISNVIINSCDNGIRLGFRNNVMPQNVAISNVTAYMVNYAAIDVRAESGTRTCVCIISNVTVLLSAQDGIQLTNVQSIDIRNCTITADRNGIILTNATNNMIADCRIENRGVDHPGVAFIKIDDTSANNHVVGCLLYNRVSGTSLTGFQDLRTTNTGQNSFVLCRTIGSFLLNGYDIRNSIVILPVNMGTNPKSSSVMFGTASDKPTAGLENGVYLIDSSGASKGWHYYNGAWVAN